MIRSCSAARRRLYYGRWDYKYASAARQGAAGAIIIHTTPSAGYPFQVVQTSWSGEEFELEETAGPAAGNARLADRRRLAAAGVAGRPGSRSSSAPRPSGAISSRCRWASSSPLAISPAMFARKRPPTCWGCCPAAIRRWRSRPSSSWPITIILAWPPSGTPKATISITARSITLPERPRSWPSPGRAPRCPSRPARSILFAAVGAEEQGLLGSLYLAEHPPLPAGNLAAVINIDGVNIIGPTRDVNVIGLGKSILDELVDGVARWQNRVVTPDEFPDRGYYYRSDQFSLAKIGVPGVYLHSGINVIGKPEGWGRKKISTSGRRRSTISPATSTSDGWGSARGGRGRAAALLRRPLSRPAAELPRGTRATNSKRPAKQRSKRGREIMTAGMRWQVLSLLCHR